MADDKTIPAGQAKPQAEIKRVYIGPEYSTALIVPGYPYPIRPKDLTEEEMKTLVEIYPPAIDWWKRA